MRAGAGFLAWSLLMPSPADWVEVAREIYQGSSISTGQLSMEHLVGILEGSAHKDRLVAIDADLAGSLSGLPESYFAIADFDSVEDYVEREIGFAAVEGEQVMGATYSSWVCSRGIEVSLFVEEAYRRQGVTAAAVQPAAARMPALQLGRRQPRIAPPGGEIGLPVYRGL